MRLASSQYTLFPRFSSSVLRNETFICSRNVSFPGVLMSSFQVSGAAVARGGLELCDGSPRARSCSFSFSNQNKVIMNMQIESFTNCRSQSLLKLSRTFFGGWKTHFEPRTKRRLSRADVWGGQKFSGCWVGPRRASLNQILNAPRPLQAARPLTPSGKGGAPRAKNPTMKSFGTFLSLKL